jgi:hypothetical protein
VIHAALNWIYTGEYLLPNILTDPLKLCPPQSRHESEKSTMTETKSHIDIYLFADRFGIPGLGQKSKLNAGGLFFEILVNGWNAGHILETVLAGTHQTDKLREILCCIIAGNPAHAEKDKVLLAALEKYEPMAHTMFHQVRARP